MSTDNHPNSWPQNLIRSLIFHLLGAPAAFLLTSYLSNFHQGNVHFIFLCIFFQVICGAGSFVLLKDIFGKFSRRDGWISFAVLLVAGALTVSSLAISWRFPDLFTRRTIIMDRSSAFIFLGLAILSTPGTLWAIDVIEKRSIGVIQSIQKHREGILLAFLFFLAYFIFAQSINFPGYYTRDQFFETDISDWIDRLTTTSMHEELFPVRAVHPAVLLFLRPLVWLLSIPLNENRLQAAFLLTALAGSACVFIAWLIVKQRSGSTPYALISASLLGASASHLLLSSVMETYIFSALALIFFCLLLQYGRVSLRSTIPAGIAIFGITITNLAQVIILYYSRLPRAKVMMQFAATVILTTLILNVLQVRLNPFSEPLYRPTNLLVEQRYKYNLFESARKFGERANLISRAILLYGVVAPSPYIFSETPDAVAPNFRTFRIKNGGMQVAGYRGLEDIIIKIWIAFLGFGLFRFFWKFLKSPAKTNFATGLLLCMGFNFGLHLLYGDDPMLYSPNWVYALVLFVTSAFEEWADNRWFLIGLIVFIALLTYANLGLIYQIMNVSLPFYGS